MPRKIQTGFVTMPQQKPNGLGDAVPNFSARLEITEVIHSCSRLCNLDV